VAAIWLDGPHGPAELISFLHPARQEISIDERKSISRDNAKKLLLPVINMFKRLRNLTKNAGETRRFVF